MMFDLQITMKLLGVVSVCLVTWSEITFCEETGLVLRDRSGEKIPGTVRKPHVSAFNETERKVLLECEVLGGPPQPKVEWRNSAGDVLNSKEPEVTEESMFIYRIRKTVLKAHVFKPDRYRCVVTQPESGHQAESEIDVYMKDFTTEWIINVVFDLIINAIIVFAIARGCFKACRYYRSRPTQDPETEMTAAEENTTVLNP